GAAHSARPYVRAPSRRRTAPSSCPSPRRRTLPRRSRVRLRIGRTGGDRVTGRALVVVVVAVTEVHAVRWLLHPGKQRRQQVLLLVDQLLAGVVRELVLVGHRECP